MKYESMIGSMSVASNRPYIVYGSVRGLVSTHWTPSGAFRSLEHDVRGCGSQGGYSDAYVYEINLQTKEWMACVSYGICKPKVQP